MKDYIKATDFKEMLCKMTEKFGDFDAFLFRDSEGITSRSYNDFANDISAFATALHNELSSGNKISLVGETSYDWIVAYFSIILSDNIVVPIDKELSDGEILNIIADSDSASLIYSQTYKPIANKLRGKIKSFRLGDWEKDPTSAGEMIIKGYELMCREDNFFDEYIPDPDAVCAILYTSGTTGKAKGIMLTQKNFCKVVEGALSVLTLGEKALSVLPLNHSYGFSHGMLMMLANGTTVCLNESPRYFMKDLQEFAPDCMCVVPMFAQLMYKKAVQLLGEDVLAEKLKKSREFLAQGIDKRSEIFADIHKLFGGNLQLIICGGAPLSARLMKAFREFGILMLNGYGITECSPLVSVNWNEKYCDGSVGLPIGCVEIDVKNPDENGQGEIWVKGPNVMKGYYKNPEATAQVMDGDYFNTGDIGYIKDGFLFITGRAKNIIVLSNGKNVYPEELEEQIEKLPCVSEAVVYAKENSEKITAQVFPTPDYNFEGDPQTEIKKQIDKINKDLPLFKQIREIELRDEPFEKTTTKKIKRSSLKKEC